MIESIDINEVIEYARIDPHAYRHRWKKSALEVLIDLVPRCPGCGVFINVSTPQVAPCRACVSKQPKGS